MTEPRFIACIGREATSSRIEIDLECDPRDRRLLIVSSDDDAVRRLRGLRGPAVLYVDMHASFYQRAFCRLREIREIPIERAQALMAEWRSRQDSNLEPPV